MPFGIAFLFELCYTAFSTGAISLSKRSKLGRSFGAVYTAAVL